MSLETTSPEPLPPLSPSLLVGSPPVMNIDKTVRAGKLDVLPV
jgi:hypothetical protein